MRAAPYGVCTTNPKETLVKLFASRTGALAAVGAVFAVAAAVLFVLGHGRWAGVALALALIVVIGILLISHAFAVRIEARSRRLMLEELRKVRNASTSTTKGVRVLQSSVTDALAKGSVLTKADTDAIRADARKAARHEIAAARTGNTFGTVASLYGIGWEFEYGTRVRRAPGHFETFALRQKSVAMRDAFARSATNLQFNYVQMMNLIRAMRSGRAPGAGNALKQWDVKSLLAAARVVGNQRLFPSDSGDAIALFRLVKDVFGVGKLGRADAYIFAEALSLEGRHGEAARLFRETKMTGRDPMQANLLVLNGLMTSAAGPRHSAPDWLEQINRLYEAEGLAPIRFCHPLGGSLLDSLTSDVEPRSVRGPRVTVLVPSFNGAGFIRTTLDCLVRQTWQDLEIIVIDDFSDPENRERLIAICDEYEDVTLLLQPRNLGAYMARNRGLTVATGEYVTVHDDDDWSHPQKLELQMQHLLANPEAVANMSRHARASEELVLTRINNNPSFSQPNFSSLLMRRDVLEQLGGWDTVNRGADAEFRDRLVKLTGNPVEVLGQVPHSFTRMHGTSLTAGEIGRGYIDPSRLFYQSAYFRALESAAVVDGHLQMPDFARPLNMKPGMRGKHLGTFDVVFATDYRFPGGTTALTTNEVECAAKQGLRVGMIQMDSPLNSAKDAVNPRSLEVAQLDNVEVLSLNDQVDVRLLVMRHPTVLQFAENLTSRLRVGHSVVIVNTPPILSDGTGVVFDLAEVRRNAEHLFGVAPDIVPESEVTRNLTLTVVHRSALANYDWPGFIDIERFSPSEQRERRKVPVLGRHSRPATLKWPDRRSQILSAYGGTEHLRVRVLGGVSFLPESTQAQLRERTEVIEFGGAASEEFLQGLDFWAYFHSSGLTESFGMATVEAMATGLVVFVPEYMRPNFGDGVVYATPETVQDIALEMWGDPERMSEQSRRARQVVIERYSPQAFLARVHMLMSRGDERFTEAEIG